MKSRKKKTSPVQRGENESSKILLPCESPRHEFHKTKSNKTNINKKRGERELKHTSPLL